MFSDAKSLKYYFIIITIFSLFFSVIMENELLSRQLPVSSLYYLCYMIFFISYLHTYVCLVLILLSRRRWPIWRQMLYWLVLTIIGLQGFYWLVWVNYELFSFAVEVMLDTIFEIYSDE